MKVTQQVIDIARAKLPSKPINLKDVETVRVLASEVGIVGKDSINDAYVEIIFVWSFVYRGWECKTPVVEEPALNVVELKPTTKEPGENVIQRLEQALEMAKAGDISNIVMVAITNDGEVMDAWANQSSALAMVGGLESLKFEFMNAVIERRD